jgi:hypothetical protein
MGKAQTDYDRQLKKVLKLQGQLAADEAKLKEFALAIKREEALARLAEQGILPPNEG